MLRRLASLFLRPRTLAGHDGRLSLDGDLALGGLEAVEVGTYSDPSLATVIVADSVKPVFREPTRTTNDDISDPQSHS